jgi:hypothetical protein
MHTVGTTTKVYVEYNNVSICGLASSPDSDDRV